MKFRHLSIVLTLIIFCAILFIGCNGSSGEEQTVVQTDSTQDTTEQDSNMEIGKMYEYKIEELWCKRDNNNIYGQIYIPQGENNQKFPTVIVGHGFTGRYSNNVRYAETFAKNGIVTYLFDFCGGSNDSKSDGKTTDMSILTEKKDMLSVFEKIKSLDYVDADNMFLMGESQGGVVASLCASELSNKVRGLTLLYPAYSIPDMANCLYPDTDDVPEEYSIWGMKLGKVYYADCLTFDVYDEISKYKGPVMIYHGTDDQVVPFSYSERAVEVYENAKLKTEEGVGHGFESELQYSTAEDMTNFIKSNLE
ncbi:MAG: alpha/beta hydrolase [Ruminococcus sp.]|nr:alpha/beta hydrolase [Ruminococcus sp.]